VFLKYMYIDTVKFAASVYVCGPRFEHKAKENFNGGNVTVR